MNNLEGIDLSELETVDDSPASAGEFEREERIFQESLKTVRKAMENVVQEILITLEDGTNHMIYVTRLAWENNQAVIEFATLDESRKAELVPHVEKCVRMQIEQALAERTKKKFKFF